MIIDFYLQSILFILLFFSTLRDWKEGIIPNEYLIRGIAIRILLLLHEVAAEGPQRIQDFLLKVIISLAVICIGILVRKLTGNGVGMGDIKLFAVMYLYLDSDMWISLVMCSLIAGLTTAMGIKIACRDVQRFPFAPAIFMGTLASVLWGYMS